MHHQNDIFGKYSNHNNFNFNDIIDYINTSTEYVFCKLIKNKSTYRYIKNTICFTNLDNKMYMSYLNAIHESCKANNHLQKILINVIKRNEKKIYKNKKVNKINDILANENLDVILMNNACKNNIMFKNQLKVINKKRTYDVSNKIITKKIKNDKSRIYQKRYR